MYQRVIIILAGLFLVGGSCSVSIGGGIDADAVVDGIVEIAEDQIPEGSPWEAECDADFSEAEDGDEFDCVAIAADGTELPAVVTVTDAADGQVNIQIN